MKKQVITYTNQKGQVVIPKAFRDKLNIDETVPLLFSISDDEILLRPFDKVISRAEEDDSYTEILKRTRGAWGPESEEEKKVAEEQRQLELEATERNKQPW